jgi:hypothetical protein
MVLLLLPPPPTDTPLTDTPLPPPLPPAITLPGPPLPLLLLSKLRAVYFSAANKNLAFICWEEERRKAVLL